MTDAALVIGWNEPKAGREVMAAEFFAESIRYFDSLVENGSIESFEPALLTRHGGDFNGFILVRGESDKLDALQRSDAFIKFSVHAIVCLDGFGIIDAHTGAGLQRRMQLWTAALTRLSES